jgi:hypothetical protein
MERTLKSKPENLRSDLSTLREKLVVLHKALIDSERIEYENSFGKISSPNRFLKLLINDPWFAWLQPFSALVVALDELIEDDKKPLTKVDLQKVKREASALLKVSEEGQGFGRSYFESLQREPEVILAHAAVIKLLRD